MDTTPPSVMMLVLDNDRCPVEEWLDGIRDKATRARVLRQIDKLGRGNIGIQRGVGESIAELKLDFGPGYRVYYARMGSMTIVLLGGGDKSDQSKDIARARNLWRAFESKGLPDVSMKPWGQAENAPPVSEE